MSDVEAVRRFSRIWSRRFGLVDNLARAADRAPGASRLLLVIGDSTVSTKELRERLHLDSGYLSRLLRALEGSDLVDVTPDLSDRRRRLVRLTPAGRDAWREMERRSEEAALRLLEPLSARQRTRLAEALSLADLLVRVAAFETLEPASHPNAGP